MVEEEEEESVEYDSEDSIQEYDSSSPYSLSHKRRATSLTVIPFHSMFLILSSLLSLLSLFIVFELLIML